MQQACIDLDTARFVQRLRRCIKLGFDIRHHVYQLGRHHQRALLAVHKLRQRMCLLMMAHVDAFFFG